tara:strand:- start:6781 stop:7440 length:660 start_codon:yes stop_codon:yes gene_type:complete
LEDEIEYHAKWVPLIKSYNNIQHSHNPDALIKWSSMLDTYESLLEDTDNVGGTVVDVGSGGSHLSLIFLDKWMTNGVAIDPRRTPKICEGKESMSCFKEDFMSWASRQPDNSVDVFLDGCAVIHFAVDGTSTVDVVAREINRLLSPNGFFIVSSDVSLLDDSPEPDGHLEMFNFENLFNMFKSGGLIPLSENVTRCKKEKFIVDPFRDIAVATMVFRKG